MLDLIRKSKSFFISQSFGQALISLSQCFIITKKPGLDFLNGKSNNYNSIFIFFVAKNSKIFLLSNEIYFFLNSLQSWESLSIKISIFQSEGS